MIPAALRMSVKDFFARFKLWKQSVFDSKPACKEKDVQFQSNSQQLEQYVCFIENVLLWENPVKSATCLVVTNALFWLLSNVECRVFGGIGLALLGFTLHSVWTTYVWPEISVRSFPPQASASPSSQPSMAVVDKLLEIFSSRLCGKLYLLKQLRHQKPAMFCCVSILSWFGLLVVGRSVSGPVFVYVVHMGIMVGPGIFIHCLPSQLKSTMAAYVACVHGVFNNYSDAGGDEEYLPVTTSEDQVLLTRASDMHMQLDAYDSITNPASSSDMVSGIGLMPSHEEDSLASLSDLPVSLLPLDPPILSHSRTPSDGSDNAKSDHQIDHFYGDSSSDEEAFARGLEFGPADEQDAGPGPLASLISKAVGGNAGLLAAAMRHTPLNLPTAQKKHSSSDEDFEFINKDELKNS